jgi:ketol-acid reductoisomerase
VSGPRVIGDEAKKAMKKVLDDIKSGAFAQAWIAENELGTPRFQAERMKEREQQIERVGAQLRRMMPFLDPVNIRPGD